MSASPLIYQLVVLGETYESNPLGVDKVKFTQEQEKDQVFFRTKHSGKITFSKADFDLLMLLENSSDRCSEIGVLVEHISGFFWKGYFSLNDCKFDLFKKTIEVEPSVDDAYRPVLDDYAIEYNVLENPILLSVEAQIDITNNFEYKEGSVDDFVDGWITLVAFSKSATHRLILFREVATTQNNSEGTVTPAGTGWSEIENYPDSTKWARTPQIKGPPYYYPYTANVPNEGRLFQGFFIHRNSSPLPPNPPTGAVFLINNWFNLFTMYWLPGLYSFNRCRGMLNTIRYLGRKIEGIGSFNQVENSYSTFFNEDINYVTGEPNKLKSLLLSQKTDIKDPYSTEPATKGMLSLKTLLDELKVMFDVFWYLNFAGEFRIEHRTFFVGAGNIDLTIPAYARTMAGQSKYEYQKEKLTRFEKITFSEALTDDFKQGVIEYAGICVSRKENEDTKELSVTKLVTDIRGLVLSPDDFSDTGFALLTRENFRVQQEVGDLSGDMLVNGHLSAANLFLNYHKNNRSLLSGLLNGKQRTFLSVVKTKKQTILSIPAFFPFDPNSIFITELSEAGELDRVEYSPRSNTFRLTILHDGTSTAGPAQLGRQFDDSFDNSFK